MITIITMIPIIVHAYMYTCIYLCIYIYIYIAQCYVLCMCILSLCVGLTKCIVAVHDCYVILLLFIIATFHY